MASDKVPTSYKVSVAVVPCMGLTELDYTDTCVAEFDTLAEAQRYARDLIAEAPRPEPEPTPDELAEIRDDYERVAHREWREWMRLGDAPRQESETPG